MRDENKRFKRYLLDGGFSFDDEYIPPRWSIIDRKNNKSPFRFLEFEDEYKDICDEIVDELNILHEENQALKEENEKLKKDLEHCANRFTDDGKNVLLSLR